VRFILSLILSFYMLKLSPKLTVLLKCLDPYDGETLLEFCWVMSD